ncbi:RICIN domain-containing protein [Streptomyces sp. NPDC050732]|uniref:RICIN domain-containing protein n=1 Tax=Streptomyces sp. NPDC050732 TaxID=3154632 RepID=UPI003432E433
MLKRTLMPVFMACACLALLLSTSTTAHAAPVTVTNGTQFTDTAGNGVHAHGGGVIKVGSHYYWFGENRHADNTFKAVSVYRSADLKTWEFRRNVLTQSSAPELGVANIERPKVIYNKATRKFVMWMHKENGKDYHEARAAVAVSDTVDGDYTWKGSFRPPSGTTSRDQTLFQDDDGTAYQITATENNADLHIYRLDADYTGYDELVADPWPGQWREAPALFKRDGVYFMLTSGTSGWNPNQQKYATAESLTGPWSGMKDTGNADGHGSQTTFVLPVQGPSATSYLYMGDRWGNSMGGTVNDSQYVWLPLDFPTRTTMSLPWYPRISVDTAAGTVDGVGGGPHYTFAARHSGKCVEVAEDSSDDGARVVQRGCDGGLNQQWRFEDAGGGYVRVLAQHSGKCLDVADESTADGAAVHQYRCSSGAHQQWRFEDRGDSTHRLVARHSGKCLDVADESTADGARLIQWSCGTGDHQRFERRAA